MELQVEVEVGRDRRWGNDTMDSNPLLSDLIQMPGGIFPSQVWERRAKIYEFTKPSFCFVLMFVTVAAIVVIFKQAKYWSERKHGVTYGVGWRFCQNYNQKIGCAVGLVWLAGWVVALFFVSFLRLKHFIDDGFFYVGDR